MAATQTESIEWKLGPDGKNFWKRNKAEGLRGGCDEACGRPALGLGGVRTEVIISWVWARGKVMLWTRFRPERQCRNVVDVAEFGKSRASFKTVHSPSRGVRERQSETPDRRAIAVSGGILSNAFGAVHGPVDSDMQKSHGSPTSDTGASNLTLRVAFGYYPTWRL